MHPTRPGFDASDRYLTLLAKALTAYLYPESGRTALRVHAGRDWQSKWLRRVLRRKTKHPFEAYALTGFDEERRTNGLDWPDFGYSMIGLKRMDNLRTAIRDIVERDLPGDLVETGVWRGGALIMMAAALEAYGSAPRRIWGFDSFQGMPKPDFETYPKEEQLDLSGVRHLVASENDVAANFARFDVPMAPVTLVPGWFRDTVPAAQVDQIALLRLDGDHYESTILVLDHLYDRVVPGGWVIVDDYFMWDACRAAVQDFWAARGLNPDLIQIDQSAAYWIKPADNAA